MPSDTSESTIVPIEELLEKFSSGSTRQRRRLVNEIESRSKELTRLGHELFDDFDRESDNWSNGWILQVLNRHEKDFLGEFLKNEKVPFFLTRSSLGIDYAPLQQSLLEERFEEADRITSSTLRELVGPSALDRGYVYFSEVEAINSLDLISIDRLWTAYSLGRFGFSAQARILNSLGGSYEKLWPRIGWKNEGVWTRYPKAFTWTIKAPEGHMPLVNQLRGVRLMDAYLKHPFLQSRLKSNLD